MYFQDPCIDISGDGSVFNVVVSSFWGLNVCTTENTSMNAIRISDKYLMHSLSLPPCCRLCCHSQLQDRGSNCRSSSARGGESSQPGSEECECLQTYHSSDC